MISVLTGCVDVIILWLPGCLSLGLFTISRVEIAPAGTRSSAVTCNMKYAGPAQPEPPTWPLTTKWCLENFTRYLTLTSLTLAGKRCSGQFYLPSFLNVKCQRNSHRYHNIWICGGRWREYWLHWPPSNWSVLEIQLLLMIFFTSFADYKIFRYHISLPPLLFLLVFL